MYVEHFDPHGRQDFRLGTKSRTWVRGSHRANRRIRSGRNY
jgi:hypothetical protein